MGGVKETAIKDGHSLEEMGGVKADRPKVGGGAINSNSRISIINKASGIISHSMEGETVQGVRPGPEDGQLNTLATQEGTMDSSSTNMMVITRDIPMPPSLPLSNNNSRSRRLLSMLLAARAHLHFKNFCLLTIRSPVMIGAPLLGGSISLRVTRESPRPRELEGISHRHGNSSHRIDILH